MISSISLTAVTKVERHDATSCALDGVNSVGGWVDDTQFFSNKMVIIRSVLPHGKLEEYINLLLAKPIQVVQASPFVVTAAMAEQPGSLQLTFMHDEPDLIRPVPAIPGE